MRFLSDPVAVLPLDDHHGEYAVVHEVDDQRGGTCHKATLRDAIFIGKGKSIKDSLNALADDLQKQVDNLRARAEEYDY